MVEKIKRVSIDYPTSLLDYVTKYKEQTGISKHRIFNDALKNYQEAHPLKEDK